MIRHGAPLKAPQRATGPTKAQIARAQARHDRLAAAVARGARPAQICLHEAAHAVLAHELGRKVVSLAFSRRGAAAGYQGALRPDPLEEGMIAMAGHAAEVLWCRQPEWAAPQDDDRALRALGFRGRSFPTLLALAQGQCVELEKPIRRVAAALERADLDRRAFLRALRDPPTEADLAARSHLRRWQRLQKRGGR